MASRIGSKASGNTLYLAHEYSAPDYAATLAITPNAYETVYNVGTLTGTMTINATISECSEGDKIVFLFQATGGTRVVTFGTNIEGTATLSVVADGFGSATFRYNGSEFVEISRSVTS